MHPWGLAWSSSGIKHPCPFQQNCGVFSKNKFPGRWQNSQKLTRKQFSRLLILVPRKPFIRWCLLCVALQLAGYQSSSASCDIKDHGMAERIAVHDSCEAWVANWELLSRIEIHRLEHVSTLYPFTLEVEAVSLASCCSNCQGPRIVTRFHLSLKHCGYLSSWGIRHSLIIFLDVDYCVFYLSFLPPVPCARL